MLNHGDTAWVLLSAALVLLMTPGLAFFYSGLVPARKAVNTMNMCFISLAFIPVVWTLVGYSWAFATGKGLASHFNYAFLNHISSGLHANSTIPEYAFLAFQMMFAVITPAIISGSVVGRMKFKAYVLFIIIWSLLVYSPMAHWVWSADGWLANLGAIDFAGGTVVHITAGFAGLVAATILGPRHEFANHAKEEAPHNVPFVILGASLLWFGWFGFNAGSALAANGLASLAFVTTTLAAAAAIATWSVLSWMRKQHSSGVGSAIAAVIGLVAITPAAGFVSPIGAILIGIIATIVSYFTLVFKNIPAVRKKLWRVDDTLDVFACHGVAGVTGSLLTGVFATKAVNPAGENGLLYGNPELFLYQIIATLAAIAMSVVGTAVILLVLKKIMRVRATAEEVELGIDLAEHGESAYQDVEKK